ncbi:MAG: SDR family NAD(P)-dependent oxidoreductase [Myxococcales bacterium]
MHIAITGASSGIGAALARELGQPETQLTLVARRRELLEEVAGPLREKGARCRLVQHDLSRPAQAAGWIAGAEQELGPIDVLINNAGALLVAPTAEIDVERAEATLLLDLLTPLRLIRAVLPAMVARRSGCIVNIASMAALAPTPGMTWYNAAKGGLAAASESLGGELRKTGVHVVTVYPGVVDTALARAGVGAYEGRLTALIPKGDAATLARLVRRAVEKRQERVIYPLLPYALARWFPGSTRFLLDHFTPAARSP